MTVRLLPDPEVVAVGVLRGSSDITDLIGTRVGTELYAGTGAALQITLVDGTERVRLHLDAVRLQVDAWGGTKAEAQTLAATARAVLLAAGGTVTATAVITDARTLIRPHWLPDPEFSPPRPRYSADYELVLHPLPS